MTENQIGKKINQFRKEKGLTIKDFSEMSGISTALVSQLERGIGNPTLSVLRQICRTLETSMSSLFFEEIDNASLICRASGREHIHNPNEKNSVYYNLTPGPLKSNVGLLLMSLNPHSETNEGISRRKSPIWSKATPPLCSRTRSFSCIRATRSAFCLPASTKCGMIPRSPCRCCSSNQK